LQKANATLEKKVEERTQQLRAFTGDLTLAEQRERSRLANILHDHLQQVLVAAKFRLMVLGRGGDNVVKLGKTWRKDLKKLREKWAPKWVSWFSQVFKFFSIRHGFKISATTSFSAFC
jgi:hypothetical protein